MPGTCALSHDFGAALASRLDPPRPAFAEDPVGFASDTFGFYAWSKQRAILEGLRDHERVAVRSSHGVGKTSCAAIAILWFLATRPNSRVISTAPTWTQVEQLLWRAIRGQVGRAHERGKGSMFPTPQSAKLELGPEWFAIGQSTDQPERFQGHHAEHLLLVVDEASGVAEPIFEAAEGFLTAHGAKVLTIGNPTQLGGQFYRAFTSDAQRWHQIHISTFDTPNYTGEVVPPEVAQALPRRGWAEEMAGAWGEDSPLYQVRVLGNFPSNEADSVIPLAWVEAAQARWKARDLSTLGPLKTIGVDVARTGSDRTVLALRYGLRIHELRRLPPQGTMETTGHVRMALAERSDKVAEAPTAIVDVIGVGAGVVDRLQEQGEQVVPFNASERSERLDRSGLVGFSNCLSGEDRVRPVGDLMRIYRARYEGPLLKVKTASGDEFTATPNHKVLTLRGWVSVQALNVGEQLCDPSGHDAAPVTAVGPEVDDVPPTLGEVYRAAHRLFGAERVEHGAVDFHGDRPVDDVDVVTVDRALAAVGPAGGQLRQDAALLRALVGKRPLPRHSALTEPLHERDVGAAVGAAFPDDVVACGALLALGNRQPIVREVGCLRAGPELDASLKQSPPHCSIVHAEGFLQPLDRLSAEVASDDVFGVEVNRARQPDGLGAAPWLDAMFGQDSAGYAPLDPEALRQRVQRLASEMPTDQVVSVDRVDPGWQFVYTLETSTGTYRSSRTLHRNCRTAGWWNLREMLDPASGLEVELPPDEKLTGDLTTPKWRPLSGGKIQVESKDDIRKRLGRSTDDGDATVQAFWPEGGPNVENFASDPDASFFATGPSASRWQTD